MVESAAIVENNDKQQLQTTKIESAETTHAECDDGRVINCRTLPLFNYTDLTPPPVGADADILQDENCPLVIISPSPPLESDNNKSLMINNNVLNCYNDRDNDDISCDGHDGYCLPEAATVTAKTTTKVVGGPRLPLFNNALNI